MTKFLLAASAVVLIAAPALAAERQNGEAQADARAQAVSTRGVDFSNQQQVREFYNRLHVAAQAVCDSGSSLPRPYAVDYSCVREVVAHAVKVADKPVLTALYNSSADSNRAFAGNDQ